MVNVFVEKIIVHERDRKGSPTSKQRIEIYFNFIGSYLPKKEPLSEEEQAKIEEERKIKERKDRLHQNYLKRKTNGKQAEWEKKYKAKREKLKQEKLTKLKTYGIPLSEYKNINKGAEI